MVGPDRRLDVLLVSSSGGVLLDVLALSPWWRQHRVTFVAVPGPDTSQRLAGHVVHWQQELAPASTVRLAVRLAQATAYLRMHSVDVVVSAGSGVAVPWFFAAKLLRVPRVWVETFNVVGRPGLASRLCASIATTVLVQHRDLLAGHRRAIYVGELY
ncbi:MAG: glycosyltransferase [Nocardioidaceae bacterium]